MENIGDFARLGGVSVRMLRHYDAIGLLVPAYVDPATGYRRYEASQFTRLNRIVALRDLGFGLEQVRLLVDEDVTPEEIRGMLRLRRSELQATIRADRDRLDRVERRLRTIESEATMSENAFETKPLPALRLAQVSTTVPSLEDIGSVIGPAFERLAGSFFGAGLQPSGPAVGYYRVHADGSVDATAGLPYDGPPADGFESGELDAVETALTTVHHGSMDSISSTWQELVRAAEQRGLRPWGIAREVYLEMGEDPAGWVTELQQPVV